MFSFKSVLLFGALTLGLFGLMAVGQTSKGFIVGTVTDPNGASVAGATVGIANAATGVARETQTQGDGNYRFDAVDPGNYTLEVNAAGFKKSRRDGVVVNAAQTSEATLQLEVGSASEEVVVTAETPVALQTEDGARVSTLDQRQITDLPIAGLNPVSLVLTLPGVTDTMQTMAGGFVQGTEFNVNGLRARSNNQLVDGLDNNDNSISGQFYQPVLRDGYNEVIILTSDYSAEFGRAGGAVVNVITRGGTNSFHGSVYDVLINNALNSLTAGQKRDGLTEVPHYVENIYGFSLGGPILKNKLFFFGTFQADQARSSQVATGNIPTEAGYNTLRTLFPAGKNPNLDRYLNIVGNLRGATDPFTVALGGNRPGVEFGTVTRAAPQPVNDYQYLARVDWTPTERDNLAFRYVADKQTFANQSPTIFAGYEVDVPSLIQNQYISYTRNISLRTTNEFRFGYGRFNVLFAPPNADALVGPTFTFSGGGLGRGITGVGLSATFPQGRIFNNFQFQDTITHTAGNHTIRAGVDLNVQRAKQFVPINTRGGLTFAGGGGFSGLGNFVDQFSGTGSGGASIVFGSPVTYPNAFLQNYFVNDQWRVRDNLTLNLGLRYENYGTPFNAIPYPAFAGFDQPLLTRAEQRRDNNNFAPRLSFAYQPRTSSRFGKAVLGGEKSVIRGGVAVNYDTFFNNILSNTAATPPNAFGATSLGSSVGERGFGSFGTSFLPTTGTPSPLAAVNTIPTNLVNPISYVWNLGVQREIPFGIITDVAYVGSRGTKLFINEQLNPGVGGFGAPLLRQYPARGSIIARTNGGDSNYHSLQVRAERGLRNGFLFRAAYTFSKAIDDVNSEIFTTSGGTSTGSDYFNRRVDRGVASYDIPHAFSLTTLYDIPSLARAGFWRQVTGGFRVSAIYRLQSGAVESPFVGGIDLNGDGSGFNDRPSIGNLRASRNSVAILGSLVGSEGGGYVDANGNVIYPANAYYIVDSALGNRAARNSLRGPRFNRLDLTLSRSFGIPFTPMENDRFEIRADFFNAFNHPNLGPGTGDVTDTTFNDPTYSVTPSQQSTGETVVGNVRAGRIIQFQLRYTF